MIISVGVYTGSRSAPILRASIHQQDGCAWLDLDAGLYYRLPEDEVEAANKKKPISRIAPRLLVQAVANGVTFTVIVTG